LGVLTQPNKSRKQIPLTFLACQAKKQNIAFLCVTKLKKILPNFAVKTIFVLKEQTFKEKNNVKVKKEVLADF
jgi:hypothetical protein